MLQALNIKYKRNITNTTNVKGIEVNYVLKLSKLKSISFNQLLCITVKIE